MNNNRERRFYSAEVRADPGLGGDEKSRITGYGAVFNQRSENLGGFREIIMPTAFDDIGDQDVRGLFNHDSNYVLGRTASGTMTLKVDSIGYLYDIETPDTQTIRDLVISPMMRGDISQSSVTFVVGRDGDKWYEDDDGVIIREIHSLSRVFDIGPVAIPAYADTSAASRSFEAFKNDGFLKRAIREKRSRERLLTILSI